MSLAERTIHLASDHAGFAHKEAIRDWLQGEGLAVVDHGAKHHDPLDDFPDFIALAAAAVQASPQRNCAVIFGGSGQGEAMAANRFSHVRATAFYGGPDDIITLSREHNDANVLSLGARFVSVDEAKRVVWDWLHGAVSNDPKYTRRNKKLSQLPNN